MQLSLAREHVSESLSENIRQAYAAHCAAHDALGNLATAMATIEEQWSSLPVREQPRINIGRATARLYEAFFSLDEARETVDEALEILTDNGIDLPRFPERP